MTRHEEDVTDALARAQAGESDSDAILLSWEIFRLRLIISQMKEALG